MGNYESPITQYLTETFIQLNPILYIKRNIYFMNQAFTNDNFLMFVFGDNQKPEVKPLYSRYEEYSLYKGLERYEYDFYSKIYIRADLKKTYIKRKYKKFMEFYEDASSLLIAIYDIVTIILNYFSSFYGYYNLSKEIFFFKDLEDPNKFSVTKKTFMIHELISITDNHKNKSENIQIEIKSKIPKNVKNFPPKKGESERRKVLDSLNDSYHKDIQIYNNNLNNKVEDNRKKTSSLKERESKDNKNKNYKNEYNSNLYDEKNDEYFKGDYEESYPKYKVNQMKLNKRNKLSENGDVYFSESVSTNIDDYSSEFSGQKKAKKKRAKIENSFNIFEVVIIEFLKCLMSDDMRIKYNANEKANEILFKKMDIITHVRNTILFDVINQTMIDDNKKTIINLLGSPVISIDKKGRGAFDEFYKTYKEKEFNKFFSRMKEITEKNEKDEREIELISMSNEYLRVFID